MLGARSITVSRGNRQEIGEKRGFGQEIGHFWSFFHYLSPKARAGRIRASPGPYSFRQLRSIDIGDMLGARSITVRRGNRGRMSEKMGYWDIIS